MRYSVKGHLRETHCMGFKDGMLKVIARLLESARGGAGIILEEEEDYLLVCSMCGSAMDIFSKRINDG